MHLLRQVMSVHRTEMAEYWLDAELAAVMCCDSELRHTLTTCGAIWWRRFARQYEQWAALSDDSASASSSEDEERRARRHVEERRVLAMNWAWACRNWQRFGQPDCELSGSRSNVMSPGDGSDDKGGAGRLLLAPMVSTRYAEYRTWMLSSMGVRMVYAIIECDTHSFFAWLPHDSIRGHVEARERGYNMTVARWLEMREQRQAELAAAAAPATASQAPVATEKRTPFVYSRTREHHRDKSYRRHSARVELTGLSTRLACMCQLATAGVAFCVHAVVLYGNRFDDAAERAVQQHTRSIGANHQAPRRARCDQSVGREEIKTENKQTTQIKPAVATAFLRGDIPRQVAGNDPTWRGADQWPIKDNLCARRVTAFYDERLYADVARQHVCLMHIGGTQGSQEAHMGTLVTESRQADGRSRLHSHFSFQMRHANLFLSHSEIAMQPPLGVSPGFPVDVAVTLSKAIAKMIRIRGILDPADCRYSSRHYSVLGAAVLLPLFSAASPCSASPPTTSRGRPTGVSPMALVNHGFACLTCGTDMDDIQHGRYCVASDSGHDIGRELSRDVLLCHTCRRQERAQQASQWGPPPTKKTEHQSLQRNREILPIEYHGWCAQPAPYERVLRPCVHGGSAEITVTKMMGVDVDPESPDHGLCHLQQ
jgi:hypothetical protein